MASLIIVSGPNEGDYYPCGNRTLVIGRDEACPIQILDSKASRRHVQIRWDDAKHTHVVTDMKSTNGTLLNGRTLMSETTLVDNDAIVIGETTIVFNDQEFSDKESALKNWKKRGERIVNTVQQK